MIRIYSFKTGEVEFSASIYPEENKCSITAHRSCYSLFALAEVIGKTSGCLSRVCSETPCWGFGNFNFESRSDVPEIDGLILEIDSEKSNPITVLRKYFDSKYTQVLSRYERNDLRSTKEEELNVIEQSE